MRCHFTTALCPPTKSQRFIKQATQEQRNRRREAVLKWLRTREASAVRWRIQAPNQMERLFTANQLRLRFRKLFPWRGTTLSDTRYHEKLVLLMQLRHQRIWFVGLQ